MQMGKIAGLVQLETSGAPDISAEQLQEEVGKKLSMHIVASSQPPLFLNVDSVPADFMEKETAILR
jgi:translation elongation factor EF-Ts